MVEEHTDEGEADTLKDNTHVHTNGKTKTGQRKRHTPADKSQQVTCSKHILAPATVLRSRLLLTWRGQGLSGQGGLARSGPRQREQALPLHVEQVLLLLELLHLQELLLEDELLGSQLLLLLLLL